MKRKIAMFTSTWSSNHTSELINGILEVIREQNLELHVFNTYNAAEKIDIVPKEQDILTLPCLDSYAGVLIMYTSVGSYPEVDALAKRCSAMGKPVLCIDQDFGEQPFIGIDNYQSFYQVVEHMITVHNCKTLNFLGGPQEHPENSLRYKAFVDCLDHYHIPLSQDRVLFFNFLHSDGKRAYDIWKEKNMHLPDALICASDHMALGYCVAAEDDGYLVPRDFKLTGFDNLEEAQNYIPSITSVNRGWRQLGKTSITKLLAHINGSERQHTYTVKGELVANESCGCHNARPLADVILRNFRSNKTRDMLGSWSRIALQIFCNASSEDDIRIGLSIGEEKLGLLQVSLCLNHSLDNLTKDTPLTDYIDNFHVICADHSSTVTRAELIPAHLRAPENDVFIFSPLHFGYHNFGYSVIPYKEGLLQYDKHRKFIDYLCLALECTTQREILKLTNKQLENLYLLDQLTGLYNRFGYTDLGPVFFRENAGKVSIFYIDLDNLKQTNDLYGHALGDKSLRALAEGMKQFFSPEALKIRMGGDEFLVIEKLLPDEIALEKQKNLEQFLTDYQLREQLPITLSASIGYLRSTDPTAELEVLVRNADKNMYQIKQAKKNKSS